jgi:hypothetical protein
LRRFRESGNIWEVPGNPGRRFPAARTFRAISHAVVTGRGDACRIAKERLRRSVFTNLQAHLRLFRFYQMPHRIAAKFQAFFDVLTAAEAPTAGREGLASN